MSGMTVFGVVKQGVVIPETPLPEGARVEIVVPGTVPDVSPELQAELDAWDRASDETLNSVERSASIC